MLPGTDVPRIVGTNLSLPSWYGIRTKPLKLTTQVLPLLSWSNDLKKFIFSGNRTCLMVKSKAEQALPKARRSCCKFKASYPQSGNFQIYCEIKGISGLCFTAEVVEWRIFILCGETRQKQPQSKWTGIYSLCPDWKTDVQQDVRRAGAADFIVRKCLVGIQCRDHVKMLSEGSHPHLHDLQSGFKASPCVTTGKGCLMIGAAASFRREKPATARRSSLKARGTLSEADQLRFFNSLLYLIYKATCSLLESEKLCCVQTDWKRG